MLDHKIIQLDKEISNKIAAGEVVERPLAVVKELVENSIDSGATKITIEIKDAGKSFIRITDNGRGINPDDMELAFERHSTSKIRTINDIYNISSLGFRGEALASIASVSNVEMISKHASLEIGEKILISGGKVLSKSPTGAPQGTTIFIKDLFFNTPARLKFLKSNNSELSAINDIVNKLALSHPEVSFKYIVGGENIFITPGNNKLYDVILNIFQKTISKNLIEIDVNENGIKIEGFVSNLDSTRGNRQYQIVFVNNRYVKSKVVEDAISLVYRTLIPQNRFPIVFINIIIDPTLIDINIHPSKTEIRFHQDGLIKDLIYKTLKYELNKYNLVQSKQLNSRHIDNKSTLSIYSEINKINNEKIDAQSFKADSYEESSDKVIYNTKAENSNSVSEPFSKKSYNIPSKIEVSENRGKSKILLDNYKRLSEGDNVKVEATGNKYVASTSNKTDNTISVAFKREDKFIEPNYQNSKPLFESEKETIYDNLIYVGQLFQTYLIYEKSNEMFLIDQHAAHEKILFEEYVESFRQRNIVSQLILEPIVIEVNYMEKIKILENLGLFLSLGFSLEEFGDTTIIVREIPQIFNINTSKTLVESLIDNLDFNLPEEQFELSLTELMQHSCKMAIKANDRLTTIEVNSLVKQLKKLRDPYTCPHGRPIIISISKSEMEKKFNRT